MRIGETNMSACNPILMVNAGYASLVVHIILRCDFVCHGLLGYWCADVVPKHRYSYKDVEPWRESKHRCAMALCFDVAE